MKDHKILLLGGTGFLGKWVNELLKDRGYTNIYTPSRRNGGFDFTKEADVIRVFRTSPDYVINLAAFAGGIGLNQQHPGQMIYNNLKMGLEITHYAMHANPLKYIYVGSCCSYPKYTPAPFKEENLWNGFPEETNAPYGIAKRAIGLMMQAYKDEYGLNSNWLVPANLYGEGDNFDLGSSHVVPAMIKKFYHSKGRVTLWGDGTPTRELLHVEDCARAIVLALESDYNNPEPINIGSGTSISMLELANKISQLMCYDGEIIWDESKPNGQPSRSIDSSRAESVFGYRPEISLEDGLHRTMQWYKSENLINYERYNDD